MKLTISEHKFHDSPIWCLELHVGDTCVGIGDMMYSSKEQCIKAGEEMVLAFAKEKISVIHDEIY